jgi:TonB family protein
MKRRMAVVSCVLGLVVGAALIPAMAEEPAITRFVDDGGDRVPLHTVAPVYPRNARRDRIEGRVQVCYEIDRRGRPYRVAVRSSSHRVFEKAAKRAVRASLWVPLAAGEEASKLKSCRTFTFELQPVSG